VICFVICFVICCAKIVMSPFLQNRNVPLK
jgi:hypothetical protein